MNRRRQLSNLRRTMGRGKGINAAAWFAGQSFHASASDVPLERLPISELDKAGAALLSKTEPVYIRILDRAMNGYGFHTVCTSWSEAMTTWMDGQEPIAIRIVNGNISVFRG